MNKFKEQFESYTSEHLIEKRALGDDLADEAHRAIEEIFAERGEYLPPRPSAAIDIKRQKKTNRSWLEISAWIFILLLVNGVSKTLAHTWFGVVFTVCFVAYLVIKWVLRKTLSKEERAAHDEQKRIDDEGLYELMVVAAKGDTKRVEELLNYGADVNVVSVNGATALMYAARNNHVAIAKALINAGANVNAANDKKSTALSIAEKQQHTEMAELLKLHGAR